MATTKKVQPQESANIEMSASVETQASAAKKVAKVKGCCGGKGNKELPEKNCCEKHHGDKYGEAHNAHCNTHSEAHGEAHSGHHKHHGEHATSCAHAHHHAGHIYHKEHAKSMAKKRKIAKAGMIASLGVLTVSGFTKVLPYAKKTHTIAGIALLGFSAWHASLYKCTRHKKRAQKEASDAHNASIVKNDYINSVEN